MLNHKILREASIVTRAMDNKEFSRYTRIAHNGRVTAIAAVKKIRDVFYETHRDAPQKSLDELWGFVEPKIAKNPGLAAFTLDYGGASSAYFFPWLKAVYTSPSLALEMAYGWGYDVHGNWTKAPETDEIYDFVCNDPTFVFHRERQLMMADLVMTVTDNATVDTPARVVDFGAGRMPWMRYTNFQPEPEKQTICAFDMDATIDPAALLMGDARFTEDVKHSVHYERLDMFKALKDPKCHGVDLVMLGGVASYYPLDVFREAVMRPVHGLLRENGTFFFDMQLSCPYLERSVAVFDWPELQLRGSATRAIGLIETMRRDLWLQGVKFSAEYAMDTVNATATAVMATFAKT